MVTWIAVKHDVYIAFNSLIQIIALCGLSILIDILFKQFSEIHLLLFPIQKCLLL